MPGEPAATQTRMASRTDGTRPPLELRTVATLFTLTESFTMTATDLSPQPFRSAAAPGGTCDLDTTAAQLRHDRSRQRTAPAGRGMGEMPCDALIHRGASGHPVRLVPDGFGAIGHGRGDYL